MVVTPVPLSGIFVLDFTWNCGLTSPIFRDITMAHFLGLSVMFISILTPLIVLITCGVVAWIGVRCLEHRPYIEKFSNACSLSPLEILKITPVGYSFKDSRSLVYHSSRYYLCIMHMDENNFRHRLWSCPSGVDQHHTSHFLQLPDAPLCHPVLVVRIYPFRGKLLASSVAGFNPLLGLKISVIGLVWLDGHASVTSIPFSCLISFEDLLCRLCLLSLYIAQPWRLIRIYSCILVSLCSKEPFRLRYHSCRWGFNLLLKFQVSWTFRILRLIHIVLGALSPWSHIHPFIYT